RVFRDRILRDVIHDHDQRKTPQQKQRPKGTERHVTSFRARPPTHHPTRQRIPVSQSNHHCQQQERRARQFVKHAKQHAQPPKAEDDKNCQNADDNLNHVNAPATPPQPSSVHAGSCLRRPGDTSDTLFWTRPRPTVAGSRLRSPFVATHRPIQATRRRPFFPDNPCCHKHRSLPRDRWYALRKASSPTRSTLCRPSCTLRDNACRARAQDAATRSSAMPRKSDI